MVKRNLVNSHRCIITLDNNEVVLNNIRHCQEAGFTVVEVNHLNSRMAQLILQQFPDLILGAGNVLTTHHLEDVYRVGVDFITSPGFEMSLVQTAQIYSMHYLPAISTLSEAMYANQSGLSEVRVFPASVAFCALLGRYFPELKLYPVEISSETAADFLRIPAVQAVSLYSPTPELILNYMC